jgi:hypothetical protein
MIRYFNVGLESLGLKSHRKPDSDKNLILKSRKRQNIYPVVKGLLLSDERVKKIKKE